MKNDSEIKQLWHDALRQQRYKQNIKNPVEERLRINELGVRPQSRLNRWIFNPGAHWLPYHPDKFKPEPRGHNLFIRALLLLLNHARNAHAAKRQKHGERTIETLSARNEELRKKQLRIIATITSLESEGDFYERDR